MGSSCCKLRSGSSCRGRCRDSGGRSESSICTVSTTNASGRSSAVGETRRVVGGSLTTGNCTGVCYPPTAATTTTTTIADDDGWQRTSSCSAGIRVALPRLPDPRESGSMPYAAIPACTLTAHEGDVNGVAFGATTLVTVGGDKTVRVWDVATDPGGNAKAGSFTELGFSPLRAHTYSVNGCTFSPVAPHMLASYSTDGRAILWDVKVGERLAVLTHPSQSSIRVCRFSPSGDMLASGSDDETLCLWDLATKKIIRSFSGQEASIPSCAFSPDSAFIVCGDVLGHLRVYATDGQSERHRWYEMNAHDLGVTCCEFSPTYGSAGAPSSVDISLPDELLPEPDPEDEEVSIDRSTAKQVYFLLASCGYDHTIKLWDFVSYAGSHDVKLTLRSTLMGHNEFVTCCSFSADGLILASAAGDKTIRLWNPIQGEAMCTVLGHSRYVTSCCFSRDGKYLASGSNDKTVRIWRVDRAELLPEMGQTEQTEVVGAAASRTWGFRSAPVSMDTAYYMKDLADWGKDEVCHWLTELDMPQYIEQFRQHAIDGTELLTLSPELLEKDLGISVIGHRNKIARAIDELKRKPVLQKRAADTGVPDEYLCPITREVMSDPVIASDGYSYEKAAILDWMKRGKQYSPMTNTPLNHSDITPNRSLKMLIERHLQGTA